jgi:type VI secretion system secreted protein Hcp
MKRMTVTVFSALLCLAIAAPARAAFDYFLQLKGIDGESTVKGYEKWIEVDSYLFDVTNAATSSGSGGASGKVTFQDFYFNKRVDSASADIFEFLVTGKHIASAVFDVVDVDGKTPRKLISYSFTDVLLTSLQHSGAEPGQPSESVAFRFDKIEVQSYSQDPKGGSNPGSSFKWDLKANVAGDAVPATPVPEPSTWLTLAAGLLILAGGSRITRMRRRFDPPLA